MVEDKAPNGSQINLADTYSSNPDTKGHPTVVSHCLASYDSVHEGATYDADVYAAGFANTSVARGELTNWFTNNGVYYVNQSAGFGSGTKIEQSDVKDDQYVFDHSFTRVNSFGNPGEPLFPPQAADSTS